MSVSRFDAGKGMFFVGRRWECFDDCLYVVALAFFFVLVYTVRPLRFLPLGFH